MNRKMICRILGNILIFEAIILLLPFLVSIIFYLLSYFYLAIIASIIFTTIPACTSASAATRRVWAVSSSGTAARRRGRQVSRSSGSTGRKYRPCRPYSVS